MVRLQSEVRPSDGPPLATASLNLAEPPGVVGCFRQQPVAEAANLRDPRRRLRTDDPVGVGGPPRQVERPDDAPADQVPNRKSGAGERDPLAVDCGIDQHAGPVQDRTRQLLRRHHPGKSEPPLPSLALILEPYEWPFQHVGGPLQAIAAGEQLRAADRKNLLRAKPRRLETRPIAITVPHRNVDVLVGKVYGMHCRRNPQIDAGMCRGKASQAMNQPFRGEIQRGADYEDASVLPLHQPLGAGPNVVERLANHDEIIPADRGNLEALALAGEELDAELGLEGLDLLAYRALGDVKLLGRAGEAFVAGGGLERPECIERRQPARHRSKLN